MNMKNIVLKVRNTAKSVYKNMRYLGKARFCPICKKSSSKFLSFGRPVRHDAMCPHCGSLERHRLTWLFLKKLTHFFDTNKQKMLHVAPEPIFENLFKKQLGLNYLSADLFNPKAMVKMDITDIQYPDNSFDIIYCSHVLEHVPDDLGAMKEFNRVLKSEGWAILLVPLVEGLTQEDLSITDPQLRLELYGQEDHVRQYGVDYIDRLRSTSWQVECIKPTDFLTDLEIKNMGITKAASDIYFCKKG